MAEEQRNIGDQNAARVRKVTPTILIGLGGTGKEVLLRLRRRFYEKYNFFGFPTMAYLWLDTDTQNTDIDGQELDHIMESVLFRQDECVNAEIPSSAFTEYFRNQRSSPHIFSWLDQKLAGMGSVVNGAGQVRPLGRLAFFHSYQDIRNKLDEAWAQVRADAAHREMATKHRIEVEPDQLNVILIFSIAGGTGSGMFLDMAFLCREALRDAKPKITGYLLLPSVFADALNANKKIFANGYAALKELEYYSWRKDVDPQGTGVIDSAAASVSRHDFVADWGNAGYGHDRSPAPIMAPAFNTCYLIDNVTQGGGVIRPTDKKYLCDMIAENIFLNFSAEEFSRHKDSIRANLEQYLGKPLNYHYEKFGTQGGYMEMFSQRFSTMGFSKLYVPIDRIRRACGYQLALDLIGEWLKPNDRAEIELQKVMETRELEQLGLRARPGSGDLVSALRKSGEITFEDEIRAETARLRESLLQQVNHDKQPSLYTQIPKFLKEFVKRNFDRSDPTRKETWGTYIVSLEQNRQKLIARECGEFDPMGQPKEGAADGQILARVKHWLKDDKTRLDQAVELLKIAGKMLDLHVSEIYVKGKEASERKAAAAAEDIKIKLEIARDEESGRIVQRRSLRILVDLICDQITEHLIERMRGWILEAAINVVQKHIKPYIGTEIIRKDEQGKDVIDRAGLILELWSLREQLSAAHKEMRARFESFERVEQHLIYENLYQPDMFRKYYLIQEQGVKHPVASKLKELESLFLQQINKDNPYDLRDLIKRQGARTFLGKLDDFCHGKFQQLEVDANALEKFVELYDDVAERRRRLQRFVKNGSVWLQMSTKAANDERLRANRQAEALISRSPKTNDKDEYEAIYKTIKELLPKEYRQPDIRTVRSADAVFLYTEYAGIPLAYVNGLDRYFEEAYLPLIREGTPLHIDYHEDKFTDILTKSNDDVDQILRANQVLLVGTILRTVTASSNVGGDGAVTFAFRSYSDGVPRVQPLGSRRIAVETLKRNEALLNAIQNENVRRRLEMTPEARLKFCAILAYHTNPGGPFEAIHRPGTGGMETYFPPEGKALDQARREEYEQVLVALGKDDTVEERARDAIARLLVTKDDFSQEVAVDKYRIRILKDVNAAASNTNT